MAFYLSPLVDVNEIDLSTTIPAVSTSIACLIIRDAYKGPEHEPAFVTNEDDLINVFGEPTSAAGNYQDMLAAIGYLKYGNKLYCTRAMPTDATFAGTKATSASTWDTFGTSAYTRDNLGVNDPADFGDITVTDNADLWIIATSTGLWGNKTRLATLTYADQQHVNQVVASGGDTGWDTFDEFAETDSQLTNAKEFLLIVQVQDQGTTTWVTKETWNVSTDPDSIDDGGASKFVETVVNNGSNYTYLAINASSIDQDWTITTQNWQTMADGDNGGTTSDATIMLALDYFKNVEEVDVNIFIDSGKSETVKQYIASICKDTRKDSVAVLDVPRSLVLNATNIASELSQWRLGTGDHTVTNLNINNSYVATYANWLEVYDKYNKRYRWIPASGHVAGIYARTDDVSDPWFAPAGLNRAILSSIRRLAWNPNQGERDLIYKNGLNPIVSFAGQGKVVWGQKTMLDKSSAFNRVNVRRLFVTIEKAIATAAKYFLFEPNDPVTRSLLINMIDPYLRDVQARRGITDYYIVIDETNNTPERIDRNELWASIFIKPTRAAEFIVLNFIATKTGASFEELAASGVV